jgi:hypothetical protein
VIHFFFFFIGNVKDKTLKELKIKTIDDLRLITIDNLNLIQRYIKKKKN